MNPQDTTPSRLDGAISESKVIMTHLAPPDFISLLNSSVVKSKENSAMSAVHNIGGKIVENSFVLRKLSTFKNGFARDLHGTVFPTEHGSQVIYRFELHIVVRIMFTLWFILVSILLLVGISSIFSGQMRLDIIIGPLLLLAGGIALVTVAMAKGKGEEVELERFLERIAQAQSFENSG